MKVKLLMLILSLLLVANAIAQKGHGNLEVEFELNRTKSAIQSAREAALAKNLDLNQDGKPEIVLVKKDSKGNILEFGAREIGASNFLAYLDSNFFKQNFFRPPDRFQGFFDIDVDNQYEAIFTDGFESGDVSAVTTVDMFGATVESYLDSCFFIGALDWDNDDHTELAAGEQFDNKIMIFGNGQTSSTLQHSSSPSMKNQNSSSSSFVPIVIEQQFDGNWESMTSALLNAAVRNRNTDLNGDGAPDYVSVHADSIKVYDIKTRSLLGSYDLSSIPGWKAQGNSNLNLNGFFDIDIDGVREAVLSFQFDNEQVNSAMIDFSGQTLDVHADSIKYEGVLDFDNDGHPEAIARNQHTGTVTIWGTGSSTNIMAGTYSEGAEVVSSANTQGYGLEFESEPGFLFGFDNLKEVGRTDITDMNSDGVLDIPLILRNSNGPTNFLVYDGATGTELWNLSLQGLPLNRNRFNFRGFFDFDADNTPEAIFTGGGVVLVDPTNNTIELTTSDFENWRVRGVADIDGDGFPEIIAEDTSATTVVILGSGSITGVESEDPVIPETYTLSQNYPNPFNPSTSISYTIRADNDVNITIYNLLGESVRTLVNENKKVGEYSVVWDGRDNLRQPVASGVYYYQLKVKDVTSAKKMVLLK